MSFTVIVLPAATVHEDNEESGASLIGDDCVQPHGSSTGMM